MEKVVYSGEFSVDVSDIERVVEDEFGLFCSALSWLLLLLLQWMEKLVRFVSWREESKLIIMCQNER